MRLVLFATVVGVGWILPAIAQTSDVDAQRAGQSILDAWNRTMIAKDAQGHAALYAADVIQVTPFGIISGKPAFTKSLEEGFKAFTANPSTLEHVAMLGPNVMLRSGTWNGTFVTPNGSIPGHGYWSDADVRADDGWQIQQESWSLTPQPQP